MPKYRNSAISIAPSAFPINFPLPSIQKLLYFSKACAGRSWRSVGVGGPSEKSSLRMHISISWSWPDWSFLHMPWHCVCMTWLQSAIMRVLNTEAWDAMDLTFALILLHKHAPPFNEKPPFLLWADNLFNWWKSTKYILFRNHGVKMFGHLCYRTLLRQRSKQNLFSLMATWQMMYIRVPGK